MLRIVIPCKALKDGKTRLEAVLDSQARYDLCASFLRQTIGRARDMAGAGQVCVLTADPAAAAIAAAAGVDVIGDSGEGLNAALAQARDRLAAAGVTRLVVLPIDLPSATPETLGLVCATAAEILIVPDHDRSGTNLLELSGRALAAFGFAYGPGSFQRHMQEAQRLGCTVKVTEHPLLAFDIDQPEDYRRWVGEGAKTDLPGSQDRGAETVMEQK